MKVNFLDYIGGLIALWQVREALQAQGSGFVKTAIDFGDVEGQVLADFGSRLQRLRCDRLLEISTAARQSDVVPAVYSDLAVTADQRSFLFWLSFEHLQNFEVVRGAVTGALIGPLFPKAAWPSLMLQTKKKPDARPSTCNVAAVYHIFDNFDKKAADLWRRRHERLAASQQVRELKMDLVATLWSMCGRGSQVYNTAVPEVAWLHTVAGRRFLTELKMVAAALGADVRVLLEAQSAKDTSDSSAWGTSNNESTQPASTSAAGNQSSNVREESKPKVFVHGKVPTSPRPDILIVQWKQRDDETKGFWALAAIELKVPSSTGWPLNRDWRGLELAGYEDVATFLGAAEGGIPFFDDEANAPDFHSLRQVLTAAIVYQAPWVVLTDGATFLSARVGTEGSSTGAPEALDSLECRFCLQGHLSSYVDSPVHNGKVSVMQALHFVIDHAMKEQNRPQWVNKRRALSIVARQLSSHTKGDTVAQRDNDNGPAQRDSRGRGGATSSSAGTPQGAHVQLCSSWCGKAVGPGHPMRSRNVPDEVVQPGFCCVESWTARSVVLVTNSDVALKLVAPEVQHEYVREVTMLHKMAGIDGLHVPKLFDYGFDEDLGLAWLAMTHVRHAAQEPSPADMHSLARSTLEKLWELGLVHGDLERRHVRFTRGWQGAQNSYTAVMLDLGRADHVGLGCQAIEDEKASFRTLFPYVVHGQPVA